MHGLISILNHLPFFATWLIQLVFCYAAVLILLRFFGPPGVFTFMGIMVIAANIQVMKLVNFPWIAHPVPLGTTLFAATYLSSDILAEYYGRKTAHRGILISFSAQVVFVIAMVMALGFTPLTHQEALQAGLPHASKMQHYLSAIFQPAPALLIAGLSSYLVSQFTDVWIFMVIKKLFGERWLWFRNNISTWLASLLDNTVFSLLAWRLFAMHPVPWKTLWISYILGTYLLRVGVSVLDTPFIYLAKFMKK